MRVSSRCIEMEVQKTRKPIEQTSVVSVGMLKCGWRMENLKSQVINGDDGGASISTRADGGKRQQIYRAGN
jgi:hypothetical protein